MYQTAMDATAFSEMKDLMGDSFNELLALALTNLPEQFSLLEQAITEKNADEIFNTAHRIKSTSGTIGALGLAEKAEAIELIGRSGSSVISAQLFSEITNFLNDIVSLLKQEINA